jgi:hypothetical protein
VVATWFLDGFDENLRQFAHLLSLGGKPLDAEFYITMYAEGVSAYISGFALYLQRKTGDSRFLSHSQTHTTRNLY